MFRSRTAGPVLAIAAGIAAAAWAGEGTNPYAGRQERETVFEFAAKPRVEKQGDKYLISFASKAACDATVAVVEGQGKVVRHLASGVLGKNAPWPFKQNSLAQEIEWDGKDDAGKPAPAGCRVTVGLGLQASLDRFLGWASDAMPFKTMAGLAVGTGGQLYVLTGGFEGSGLPVSSPHVYVFDGDGKYLRTILPANAAVPAGQSTFMDWVKTADGKDVPARHMSYIMNSITHEPKWANTGSQSPVVTPDGKLAFLVSKDAKNSSLVLVDARDGATPPGSIAAIETGTDALFDGPVTMAISPDGKWLYLTAACSSANPRARVKKTEPGHCVFRVSAKSPGPIEKFVGEVGKPGEDNAHLNLPSGVACDKAGNLYVADSGNNRLQVFKPDGSHLQTIPVKAPRHLAVHPETGAIYAMETEKSAGRLLKLGGLADPAVKASLPLKADVVGMALDASRSPAVVWCGHNPWEQYSQVLRIEDRGGTLAETPNPLARRRGWDGWTTWSHVVLMVGNRQRDELLMRGLWSERVDGRTGDVIEKLPWERGGGHLQMASGPDGRYWIQRKPLGSKEMTVSCYDPEKRQFVSLAEGKPVQTAKGKDPVTSISSWHNASGRNFPDAMGVAPNGDLYIPFGSTREVEDELRQAGFQSTMKKEFYDWGSNFANLLRVYSPDGKLKAVNALPGLGLMNGIRIGRRGEVYIVMACQPIGPGAPEGLAAGVKWDPKIWGTLVKFDSRYDKFPVGSLPGRWEGQKPDKPTHTYARSGPTRVENALWEYAGVSPQPMGGGSACCTCWRSQFDLDGFERSFVPSSQTCTVNVLDANGNVILRLGGYGNADSMGKDSPVPDPKTGEFRPRRPDDPKDLKSPLAEPEIAFMEPVTAAVTPDALYVHDRGNERVVRTVLKYRAQETVALP